MLLKGHCLSKNLMALLAITKIMFDAAKKTSQTLLTQCIGMKKTGGT